MGGRKMQQTKEAMGTILSDLREKDAFAIVTFESSTQSWSPSLVPANQENVADARGYIRDLQDAGATNLHQGLVGAMDILEEAKDNAISTAGTFDLIITLTDGMPNTGQISDAEGIKTDIRRWLEGRFSLFCLGFGEGVRYPFLEQLALQNKGLATQDL
ncbi:inter-alpha-trypsin inhibitor heavy chain H4-like [Acanthaster planci]|uniref:Inter-alpha-trypsin inhibitor heavy chain H4-like n=1 Tax=Acanthaster planci TaxID=133434 RepID=A0A8B8A6E0_ACAPL|nr:inter-alpha-trypsin inhibitor heavy chain H4-like [Acanthaster planci]